MHPERGARLRAIRKVKTDHAFLLVCQVVTDNSSGPVQEIFREWIPARRQWQFSGMNSWPLHPDALIDTDAAAIYEWRSDAVGNIMAEVATQLSGTEVELTMDVRSPKNGDLRSRLDSGQDYAALLKMVDRLNIWSFQGIDSTGYYAIVQLASFYVDQDPTRYGIEIGLWHSDGAVSPEALEIELLLAEDCTVPYVSITPTSLMDQGAWDVLRRVWGSPQTAATGE